MQKVRSIFRTMAQLEAKMKAHQIKIKRKIVNLIGADSASNSKTPVWQFNTSLFWYINQKGYDHIEKVLRQYSDDQISFEQFEDELATAAHALIYAPKPTPAEIMSGYPFGILLKENEAVLGPSVFDHYSKYIIDHYVKHELFLDRIIKEMLQTMGLPSKDHESIRANLLKDIEKEGPDMELLEQIYTMIGAAKPGMQASDKKAEVNDILRKVKEGIERGTVF